MSTSAARLRVGLVLTWVYLAVALPVPLALLRAFVWFRGLHWNYKYGNPSHQTVESCAGKVRKCRRSRMRSVPTVVRDLIDIGALMWRNPEMCLVDVYHALDAGKSRSEGVYYAWGSMFSKTAETAEFAVAVYRRGLEIYPDSDRLTENLISLLMDLKNWREAAQEASLLGWFTSGRSRYWAYSCLGYAQIQLGDYEAAAQAYTTALQLKPGCAETAAALRCCNERVAASDQTDPA